MGFNFTARIRALRKRLKEEGLDALTVMTVEDGNKNVYYLSGFSGTTGALVVSSKRAALAVDARYTERARKESGVRVVEIPRGTGREAHHAMYVREAIRALRLPPGSRVGFEAARAPYGSILAWKKSLGMTLVPTEHLVEKLRQVKDPEEIRHLTHAAKATSRVFDAVSQRIRPGMREREIAVMLDTEHLREGAVAPSFRTIVASGPNSAMPHHETGTRKIKAGESLILDFGGVFPGGYCSDLTRTIFVPGAKPHPKLVEMYRVTLQANRKALHSVSPGMLWKEYDAIARSHIQANGYGDFFLHGLGHSLGLDTHDPYDYLHDAFTEGTVVTNEPGIYIEGLGGIRIEDDLLITKTGAKNLTAAPYLSI